jgi:hypothetical protein
MEKKYSSIVFVDRVNYQNLLTASFTLDDIPKAPYQGNPNISQLTQGSLIHLNKELSKLLYSSHLGPAFYDSFVLLNDQEKKYIEDSFKDYLLNDINNDPYYQDKKYYEIVVLADSSILVIVEHGFLTFVTESKDNLIKFILDCLCHQYKFNCIIGYLMKTYISLKLNDTYFNLIKSRYY